MHSTETALINASDNLLKAIDKKSASLLVLLDLSKAFDSRNHNTLLENYENLALKLRWFSGLAVIYLVDGKGYNTKIQFQKCFP